MELCNIIYNWSLYYDFIIIIKYIIVTVDHKTSHNFLKIRFIYNTCIKFPVMYGSGQYLVENYLGICNLRVQKIYLYIERIGYY